MFEIYEYLNNDQYEILEKMKDGMVTYPGHKDGLARPPQYEFMNLYFNTPNVLMVFSNKKKGYIQELSKDKWIVLNISEDLTHLTDIPKLLL